METNTKPDRIIVGIGAIAISGAILPIFFGLQNANYVDGSPAYEMALAACYGLAGLLALSHFGEVLAAARRSKPLIAMLVLAFASALWAENPGLATRRSLALFGGTMIGVLMAARFTTPERLRFLGFLLRLLAVASLIFALLLPDYGISHDLLHPGAWIGVFNHKNGLGAYAGLGVLIECFRPGRIRSKLFWFALYLLLLIKSGSASPLAALLATWVIVIVYNRLRLRSRLTVRAIVLSVTATVGMCLAAGLGSGLLQAVLGRSADMTGRGELWSALIPTILHHPFLGYGYGAFWSGGSQQYFEVARNIHWIPMYAHNGYFEIMVSLGLVGFVLACWLLAEGGYYSTRMADFREFSEDLFPLALVVYFLIRNVTEVTLLYQNNLDWAVFVATMLSVLPGSPDRVRLLEELESDQALVAQEEYA